MALSPDFEDQESTLAHQCVDARTSLFRDPLNEKLTMLRQAVLASLERTYALLKERSGEAQFRPESGFNCCVSPDFRHVLRRNEKALPIESTLIQLPFRRASVRLYPDQSIFVTPELAHWIMKKARYQLERTSKKVDREIGEFENSIRRVSETERRALQNLLELSREKAATLRDHRVTIGSTMVIADMMTEVGHRPSPGSPSKPVGE